MVRVRVRARTNDNIKHLFLALPALQFPQGSFTQDYSQGKLTKPVLLKNLSKQTELYCSWDGSVSSSEWAEADAIWMQANDIAVDSVVDIELLNYEIMPAERLRLKPTSAVEWQAVAASRDLLESALLNQVNYLSVGQKAVIYLPNGQHAILQVVSEESEKDGQIAPLGLATDTELVIIDSDDMQQQSRIVSGPLRPSCLAFLGYVPELPQNPIISSNVAMQVSVDTFKSLVAGDSARSVGMIDGEVPAWISLQVIDWQHNFSFQVVLTPAAQIRGQHLIYGALGRSCTEFFIRVPQQLQSDKETTAGSRDRLQYVLSIPEWLFRAYDILSGMFVPLEDVPVSVLWKLTYYIKESILHGFTYLQILNTDTWTVLIEQYQISIDPDARYFDCVTNLRMADPNLPSGTALVINLAKLLQQDWCTRIQYAPFQQIESFPRVFCSSEVVMHSIRKVIDELVPDSQAPLVDRVLIVKCTSVPEQAIAQSMFLTYLRTIDGYMPVVVECKEILKPTDPVQAVLPIQERLTELACMLEKVYLHDRVALVLSDLPALFPTEDIAKEELPVYAFIQEYVRRLLDVFWTKSTKNLLLVTTSSPSARIPPTDMFRYRQILTVDTHALVECMVEPLAEQVCRPISGLSNQKSEIIELLEGGGIVGFEKLWTELTRLESSEKIDTQDALMTKLKGLSAEWTEKAQQTSSNV